MLRQTWASRSLHTAAEVPQPRVYPQPAVPQPAIPQPARPLRTLKKLGLALEEQPKRADGCWQTKNGIIGREGRSQEPARDGV
eukprot:scaffold68867_cov17-Tisochrysis_lutea.AAC.1